MRQVSADKGEKLSLRIRIFERFKSQPEMVKQAEPFLLYSWQVKKSFFIPGENFQSLFRLI